jgi:hypothetical protein
MIEILIPSGSILTVKSTADHGLQFLNLNENDQKRLKHFGIEITKEGETIVISTVGIPSIGYCGIFQVSETFILSVGPKASLYKDKPNACYPHAWISRPENRKIIGQQVADSENKFSIDLSSHSIQNTPCLFWRDTASWFNLVFLNGKYDETIAPTTNFMDYGPFVWMLLSIFSGENDNLRRCVREFSLQKTENTSHIRGRINFASSNAQNFGLLHKHVVQFDDLEFSHPIFAFLKSSLRYLQTYLSTIFASHIEPIWRPIDQMLQTLKLFGDVDPLRMRGQVRTQLRRWPQTLAPIENFVRNILFFLDATTEDENGSFKSFEFSFSSSKAFEMLCSALVSSIPSRVEVGKEEHFYYWKPNIESQKNVELQKQFYFDQLVLSNESTDDENQKKVRWIVDAKYRPSYKTLSSWHQARSYQEYWIRNNRSHKSSKKQKFLFPIMFLMYPVSRGPDDDLVSIEFSEIIISSLNPKKYILEMAIVPIYVNISKIFPIHLDKSTIFHINAAIRENQNAKDVDTEDGDEDKLLGERSQRLKDIVSRYGPEEAKALNDCFTEAAFFVACQFFKSKIKTSTISLPVHELELKQFCKTIFDLNVTDDMLRNAQDARLMY